MLAAPFAMSLNAVSKHIRVLERADLVRRRRVGREHLLSFNPAPMQDAAAWIAAQQAAWETRLDILDVLLRANDRGATRQDEGREQQGDWRTMTSAEYTITVTREFSAAPGDVYAAWTEPELMRRWMAQQVAADVRVGGRYRNELIGDDGQKYVHAGEYRVLEPGRRIVQTFRGAGIADADATSDHGEYLEVTLRSLGPARTELTLADCWDGEGMDEDGQAAVKAAWNGWLDHLAKLFPSSS